MGLKLSEIVEWLSKCDISSYVIGDETQEIVQVAGLTEAQDGEISFFLISVDAMSSNLQRLLLF
jgi:hypothetical protein